MHSQLGNTPLITAIKKINAQIDIVRLLVEMGVNVNHVDNTVIIFFTTILSDEILINIFLFSLKYKKTALHWACVNGKEDIAIYIIKSGADITLKDKVSIINTFFFLKK